MALPHFTPGKDPVLVLQEAGWDPGPVWTGGKPRPHQDSIPDRPPRSSVTVLTELPGPQLKIYNIKITTGTKFVDISGMYILSFSLTFVA
jgi:hypothetical protein